MKSCYDKYPELEVEGRAWSGYPSIARALSDAAAGRRTVIVFDCYPGVDAAEVRDGLASLGAVWFDAEEAYVDDAAYAAAVRQFVTDDRVFGIMNTLRLEQFLDPIRTKSLQERIESAEGLVCVVGVGASLVVRGDVLVYLDLARWTIQCRFAKGATNWKCDNADEDKLRKFKRGYFVEWRMADRHKRTLFDRADFLLDTNVPGRPVMTDGDTWRRGLGLFASRPFRLVPYFAPEVWGGQWMKKTCGLNPDCVNYAWAFDGVPEENSVYFRVGDVRLEIPSIDIVFYCPHELLGERVHARFGDEYPIRFDFLDTMGGQNLSLQVHPITEYIQQTFGMHYTQDESYYILDCGENACVWLGLKEGIDKDEMIDLLERAQRGECAFPAERFVNRFPAKKHDHFLIPAGTVHCSGADTMVLEISATPYIFTFKLWDWGRLGLDGKPRPVHVGHGKHVIQWDRDTAWVKRNLIDRTEQVHSDDDYTEERTGLHEREFIETRRLTVRTRATVRTDDSVCQINVADGAGAVIESPTGRFAPYEVHYAETFIVPASVGEFMVRPLEDTVTLIAATVR